MKHLNNEQLNLRIDSFLTKKHQEFPELSLRGDEKVAETFGHIMIDKILDSFVSLRMQLKQ